jgi:transcriptional regulator with XRE-family HTH domain
MTKEPTYIKELRELNETYRGKELEAALGITIRSVQNYLNPASKREPSPEMQRKISEVFANHKNERPLIYKEQVEETLQDQTAEAQSRRTLEETLKNMSQDKLHSTEIIKMLAEDKLRNTAIFEKLAALLEKQFSSSSPDPVDQLPVVTGKIKDLPSGPGRLGLGKKKGQVNKS